MRLTRKLVVVFVLGMLALMSALDARDIRDDVRADEAQLEQALRQTAAGFGASLEEVEQVAGPEAAARILERRKERGGSQVRRLRDSELGTD